MANKLPEGFNWQAITPDDSPLTPMDVLADERHKTLATASVSEGEVAYNFRSQIYDYATGIERETGMQFDLLEVAQEKPVALIFGSYT
ncbi:MAG: hypothetical protein GKR90_12520 [Pseudomonadales bacterium]|nr:hypothetical protein [Pseudomonadales bacterium]